MELAEKELVNIKRRLEKVECELKLKNTRVNFFLIITNYIYRYIQMIIFLEKWNGVWRRIKWNGFV